MLVLGWHAAPRPAATTCSSPATTRRQSDEATCCLLALASCCCWLVLHLFRRRAISVGALHFSKAAITSKRFYQAGSTSRKQGNDHHRQPLAGRWHQPGGVIPVPSIRYPLSPPLPCPSIPQDGCAAPCQCWLTRSRCQSILKLLQINPWVHPSSKHSPRRQRVLVRGVVSRTKFFSR